MPFRYTSVNLIAYWHDTIGDAMELYHLFLLPPMRPFEIALRSCSSEFQKLCFVILPLCTEISCVLLKAQVGKVDYVVCEPSSKLVNPRQFFWILQAPPGYLRALM